MDILIRGVSISEWPQINRLDFGCKLKDSFASYLLHLSFTSAHTPVNLDFSGAENDRVYKLETLMSIHDIGRWIDDLNI